MTEASLTTHCMASASNQQSVPLPALRHWEIDDAHAASAAHDGSSRRRLERHRRRPASLAPAGCGSTNAPAASNAAPLKPAPPRRRRLHRRRPPRPFVSRAVAPSTRHAISSGERPSRHRRGPHGPSRHRTGRRPGAAGISPHFTTPDDAMRYLVAAYNAHDIAAEMHVTTPDSRASSSRTAVGEHLQLRQLHAEPGPGDYSCQFDMVSMVAAPQFRQRLRRQTPRRQPWQHTCRWARSPCSSRRRSAPAGTCTATRAAATDDLPESAQSVTDATPPRLGAEPPRGRRLCSRIDPQRRSRAAREGGADVRPEQSPGSGWRAAPEGRVGRRAAISAKTLRTDRWWIQPVDHLRRPVQLHHLLDVGRVHRPRLLLRAVHLAVLLPVPRRQVRHGAGLTRRPAPGHLRRHWWFTSPAIIILIVPLGFRMTCYYYRKAYYRSFWLSPPACAVAEPHAKYTGETRFPLIIQNIHRYFFYLGIPAQHHPDLRRGHRVPQSPRRLGSRGSRHVGAGAQRRVPVVVHGVVPFVPQHHRRPAEPLLQAPGALLDVGPGQPAEPLPHADRLGFPAVGGIFGRVRAARRVRHDH